MIPNIMMNIRQKILGGIQTAWSWTGRPFGVGGIEEISKEASIYKAVIPKFLYKPPFGYPRFVDIPELRRLAKTPFVEMVISTIINEIAHVDWDIVPKDKDNYNEKHIDLVKQFFDNPNVNKENFDQQLRRILRDILTIDSGVWVKVFNQAGLLTELYIRDGGTFTLNPDKFGTFAGKADIIPMEMSFNWRASEMPVSGRLVDGNPDDTSLIRIAEAAAYFQYGWITGARPMPFGKKEVVYLMQNPQTDSIYGLSRMEILLDCVQMLVYGIDYNLDYFTNNNIPRGVFQAVGISQEEMKALSEKWRESLKTKNDVGDWRKEWHKMPFINVEGKFIPIQFTAAEMELITQQQWFSKLVWAVFGVTPSELGFTESSNRATEVIQSKVFRRKTIRPLLSLIESHINAEIIPEFINGVVLNYGEEGRMQVVKGIDDVEFRFEMYDIEEDMQKMAIYEKQIKMGIKTKNEIREEMGLEPVEGGDKLKEESPFGSPFGGQFGRSPFGQGFGTRREEYEEKPEQPKPEEKAIETKRVVKRGNKYCVIHCTGPDAGKVIKCFPTKAQAEKMHRAIQASKYGKKSKKKDSPQIKELQKEISQMLSDNKKTIFKFLDKFSGEDRLIDIKSLEDNIDKVEEMVSSEQIKRVVMDIVQTSFFTKIYENELKFNMNFIPRSKVTKFLQESAFDRIKGMTKEISERIKTILTIGIKEGKSIPKLKKEIADIFDKNISRGEMIARTEIISTEGKAVREVATQSGLEGKLEWVATLDDKTCPKCRDLNGQKVGKNQKFKTSLAGGWEGYNPTVHPSCRCALNFIID